MKPAPLLIALLTLLSTFTGSLRAADKMEIILWNTHNAEHGDRGSKVVNVELFANGSLQWKKEDVEMSWSADKDERTTVDVPALPFVDTVRVTIIKTIGNGGGLTEIQVMRGGKNLALKAKVTASGYYKSPPFPAEWVVDGITSSADFHRGYWLLPRHRGPGWIEITLPK